MQSISQHPGQLIDHDQCAQSESTEYAGALGRWMIFLSGLAIIVSILVIPAQTDLHRTQLLRDKALLAEELEKERIERYQLFLEDLESPSSETINLLAASQLGMIPSDQQALSYMSLPQDPSLLSAIESMNPKQIHDTRRISRLEKFATDKNTRSWLIIIGAIALMYGILPPAKKSA